MRRLRPLLLSLAIACGEDAAPTPAAPTPAAPPPADADNAPVPQVAPTAPAPEVASADPGAPRPMTQRPDETAVLPETPRDTPADVLPAMALVQQRDFDGAIAALDPIVAARPDDADARYWRGQARLGKLLWAEAEADLAIAVARQPEWPNARNALGAALAMQKRCDEVLPHVEKLIELMPEQPHGWQNRGHCRYVVGDLPGALSDLDKACSLGSRRACAIKQRVEKKKEHFEAKAAKGEVPPPPYATDPAPSPAPAPAPAGGE